MDFGSLLYKAQSNEQNSKGGRWYKTSFAPPKKERREPKISPNIQKFMEKMEREEKEKQLAAARKKKDLLELRSKDKKSAKRVSCMLNRTKSANLSVLDDAKDNVNTALTAAGPAQPDEDDYGFVSSEASAIYDKLMNSYANIPSEEKFSKSSAPSGKIKDILSTKDRVKAAIQKEQEEALLPRKRKRKSKIDNGDDSENDDKNDDGKSDEIKREKKRREKSSGNSDEEFRKKDKHKEKSRRSWEKDEKREEKEKKKDKPFRIPKKNSAPPPMDFKTLLQVAEKKQFEPVVLEVKKSKEERPLTQKEKMERQWMLERKQRKRDREEGKVNDQPDRKIDKKIKNNVEDLDKNITPTKLDAEKLLKKDSSVWASPCNKTPSKFDEQANRITNKVERKLSDTKRREDKYAEKYKREREKENSSKLEPKSLKFSESKSKSESSKCSKGETSRKKEETKVVETETVPQRKYLPGDIRATPSNTIQKIDHDKKPSSTSYDSNVKKSSQNDADIKKLCYKESNKAECPRSDKKKSESNEDRKKKHPDIVSRPFPPADVRNGKTSSGNRDRYQSKDDRTSDKYRDQRSSKVDRSSSGYRDRFSSKNDRPSGGYNDRKNYKNDDRYEDTDEDEEDDEYDSELDDFIDDDEGDDGNYSGVISQIFKYDKNKYRDESDDDGAMESNFSQLQKEEYLSTKYGILEDLADIRRDKAMKEKKLRKLVEMKKAKR